VRITYDPAKHEWTLRARELDFGDAVEVFADPVQTDEDTREDYGEKRFVTVGYLRGRMVVVVWTPRGDDERRIISMRKANDREQAAFGQQLGKARRDDG
jgi:uncharacterized DUF497 family protein